ncbi:MAG: hypothetical protein CVU41_09775 [Chloroflexi bacterium HGW-Chloroflexi-3]|nr:MAG: hypothetical protein CVU41_09775 [Chloroflexi bacterium HGW-Chloroflexi-3]
MVWVKTDICALLGSDSEKIAGPMVKRRLGGRKASSENAGRWSPVRNKVEKIMIHSRINTPAVAGSPPPASAPSKGLFN